MGSRVVVTNLHTGQSAEVRINDRGPFIRGRMIDLSYAAARSIGMWSPGVVPVRIEVFPVAAPPLVSAYAVLVGSSSDVSEASALLVEVGRRYADVYLNEMSSGLLRYYQVRLGPFHSRHEAVTRAREATQTGLQAIVVGENERLVER
jgi:rare lipoprotein A